MGNSSRSWRNMDSLIRHQGHFKKQEGKQMKAKVIREPYRLANLKIGDIVEIIPGMETDADGIWNVPAGKLVLCKKEDGTFTYASLLDMEIIDYSVNWEIFRREAAKDLMPLAAEMCDYCGDLEKFVEKAIEIADELIKQLKEEKK